VYLAHNHKQAGLSVKGVDAEMASQDSC